MGMTPAKFFPPPTPYGQSPAVGVLGPPAQPTTTSDSLPNYQPPGSGVIQAPGGLTTDVNNQLKLKLPYQGGGL